VPQHVGESKQLDATDLTPRSLFEHQLSVFLFLPCPYWTRIGSGEMSIFGSDGMDHQLRHFKAQVAAKGLFAARMLSMGRC
jgi:hypothetical protein